MTIQDGAARRPMAEVARNGLEPQTMSCALFFPKEETVIGLIPNGMKLSTLPGPAPPFFTPKQRFAY